MTFGQAKKLSLEHFLGTVFNSFVHFLQYFDFYASYDSDFLLTYCPDSEECFSYPDHVVEMISQHCAVI